MVRPNSVWFTGLTVLTLLSACGGTTEPDLFSDSGGKQQAGSTGNAGGHSLAGGESATGGRASSTAGDSGLAGEHAGGASSQAGGGAAGSLAAGGQAGSGAGGQFGMGGLGGKGGGGAGGALGGGGKSSAGAGGRSGGGASGAGGAAGHAGSAGSAGSAGELGCQELELLASQQLAAARGCNLALNAQQCTGKVATTCNCQAPVNRDDSPETQAYLSTLKQIDKQKCSQMCPAIACLSLTHAQCSATSVGSSSGTCVAGFGLPL